MKGNEFRRRVKDTLRAVPQSLAALFRRQYTRTLENEIARLRAENRALINSILGVAGIPPLRAAAVARASARANLCSSGPVAAPSAATDLRLSAVSASDLWDSGSASRQSRRIRGTGRELHHSAPPCADVPLRSIRRRSWQQIGRALEIEDARQAQRERETNAETFPAPRQIVPRP